MLKILAATFLLKKQEYAQAAGEHDGDLSGQLQNFYIML